MTKNNRTCRLGPMACAPAVALLALAACSSGGSSLGEVDRVFLSAAGSWDTNRDGVVTCDEWKAYASDLFSGADANGDGSVDRTEYATIVSTDRMFQTVEFRYYDTNGDGKLDRAEFVDKPNRAFALLDKIEHLPAHGQPGRRGQGPHREGLRHRQAEIRRPPRKEALYASGQAHVSCERLRAI